MVGRDGLGLGGLEELGLVHDVEVLGQELDVLLGHLRELAAHVAHQHVVAVGVLVVLQLVVQAVVAERVHAAEHARRGEGAQAQRAQQLGGENHLRSATPASRCGGFMGR